MTPALIMLVIPGLPSYNWVKVYYLKGVIGLQIVISFRNRWYYIFFFLEMGSLMTSWSSAGPIHISEFPEPCPQHMFSSRNKKKMDTFGWKKAPYEELCITIYHDTPFLELWCECLFVLRFYGPINAMGSCRARSFYLTTRLLGRLSPLSG